MSETKEKVVNTWEQVGAGGVFISWSSAEYTGRHWQVIRRGKVGEIPTDPEGKAWYLYKRKTFNLENGDARKKHSDPSLEKAKAWASEKYGVKNWRRNRMGDYVDADKDYPELRKR